MTQPRPVAIVLPSLVPGDATGNDALGMAEVAAAAGHETQIFAGRIAAGLPADPIAAALDWIERRSALVVYHLASGWAAGRALLERTRSPIIVRDHNITPSRFFLGVSEEFLAATQAGEADRRHLAVNGRVRCFITCSPFSAGELQSLGADPARLRIAAPLHPLDQLETAAPDPRRLRLWAADPADALFVGRFAPNKGHLRLLRVAARHRELFGEALRLRIVGRQDPRLHRWQALVRQECRRLDLDSSVDFTGEVDLPLLKAAYLTSRLFLCCSEHEGFCLPLIEASTLGLAAVALDHGAIGSTLGPGALVLPATADDDEIAVALHRTLRDARLRDALLAAQRAHARQHFSRALVAEEILKALAEAGETGG